jgi:transcription initiation factor TFIIIB Brf1 subunit/transcription initiation factor TFIIB
MSIVVSCPECGSRNIFFDSETGEYTCYSCRHKWRKGEEKLPAPGAELEIEGPYEERRGRHAVMRELERFVEKAINEEMDDAEKYNEMADKLRRLETDEANEFADKLEQIAADENKHRETLTWIYTELIP